MAPTCSTQVNLVARLYTDINFVLGYCIATDHQIQHGIIGVQIAALKLKQPNLG